ncbi:MAG: sensor histidine kinase [Desulfatibacillaceae bacterium]
MRRTIHDEDGHEAARDGETLDAESTEEPVSGDFDREYGLRALLSETDLAAIMKDMDGSGCRLVVVFDTAGSVHFRFGDTRAKEPGSMWELLAAATDSTGTSELETGVAAWFPLSHEMLTCGHLALAWESRDPDAALSTGRILARAVEMLMAANHKVLLTSGLHGQVVEESYALLKKQNRLLTQSREKYRNLARNLEVEVRNKTEKIKEAHEILLQQEKMASIGQLAAGVAHEINNPMGFISSNLTSLNEYMEDVVSVLSRYRTLASRVLESGAAGRDLCDMLEEVLRLDTQLDIDFVLDDVNSLVNESLDGAERIKRIIIDLKDFAHPTQQELEQCDINDVVDATLNIVRNEIKYKAHVIRDYGEGIRVWCRPGQLCQVFMNILVNAAQAIEHQGEIRIRTSADGERARIVLEDNGPGIDNENLSRIFDPFFTTKDVGKGTGLGLNVAYNIVKKHNGDIQARSEPGRGTSFTVSLPLHQ